MTIFHKILFTVSFLAPLIFAHPAREQEKQCSCPGDNPQFAPIPQQALGVNVSIGVAEYETEYLGQGAYGKKISPFSTQESSCVWWEISRSQRLRIM